MREIDDKHLHRRNPKQAREHVNDDHDDCAPEIRHKSNTQDLPAIAPCQRGAPVDARGGTSLFGNANRQDDIGHREQDHTGRDQQDIIEGIPETGPLTGVFNLASEKKAKDLPDGWESRVDKVSRLAETGSGLERAEETAFVVKAP